MASAELNVRVEAPADQVWGVFSGPDMEKIIVGLYAQKVEFSGEGEGAVLTTTLLNGNILKEQIESIDVEQRCLRYRVLESGSYPYHNYHGQMQVIPCGSDACEVSMKCNYEPVGVTEEESNNIWLNHNKKVMARVKKFLGVA